MFIFAQNSQFMTVKQRHKAIDKQLNKVAQKIINAPNTRAEAKKLAIKYQVSGQTILNYIYGMGSDGFLKEALIADLS